MVGPGGGSGPSGGCPLTVLQWLLAEGCPVDWEVAAEVAERCGDAAVVEWVAVQRQGQRQGQAAVLPGVVAAAGHTLHRLASAGGGLLLGPGSGGAGALGAAGGGVLLRGPSGRLTAAGGAAGGAAQTGGAAQAGVQQAGEGMGRGKEWGGGAWGRGRDRCHSGLLDQLPCGAGGRAACGQQLPGRRGDQRVRPVRPAGWHLTGRCAACCMVLGVHGWFGPKYCTAAGQQLSSAVSSWPCTETWILHPGIWWSKICPGLAFLATVAPRGIQH